jgi:hypothetical protein
MATNKDQQLIDQAEQLGKQLRVQVDTQSLNTQQLQDLVTDLQRRVSGDQPKGRAPNKPNDQPSPADAAGGATGAAGPAPYKVAPGKSLITQRGILDENQEIRAEDVSGQETLDKLVQNGSVVKAS